MLQFNSKTDRLLARTALAILSVGAVYGAYSLGGPLYWRFYATMVAPFSGNQLDALVLDDDPFAAIEAEKLLQHGSARATNRPAKTRPFDPEDYPLNRERVTALLQDGYIMVTWANHHYLDFAKSWVYNVKKAGVTGYLVGAMDDDMLKAMVDADINTWRMNTGITKADLGWGSGNFHKMGRAKIALIKDFLEFGVDVVITDIDTAWLRNPLPFFSRYPHADILTSSDQLRETVSDESLEKFPDAGAAFNIGIMMFRPKSLAFVEDWIAKLQDVGVWDQNAFNDLSRLGHTLSDPADGNLFKGDNGKLTMGVLPVSIFASGHTFFVQRKYQELGLQPYVAHATFQYSGTPGKRHRLREHMLFDDPPEYYDDPRGFVSMELAVPQSLLDAASGVQGRMTGDKLGNHFALVHYQLARLRTALAVASVSGRIIILPPIWCELDKYWAPLEDGNVPGARWKKPFICPADHVLDLEGRWHRPMPPDMYGPHIEFREYSFLENPRLPDAVARSRVVLDARGGADAAEAATGAEVVRAEAGASMPELRQLLAQPEAARARVLHLPEATLESLHGSWQTFPPDDLKKFTDRLQAYPTTFCCMDGHPAHVWYNFLADVPHTDRFGREHTPEFKLYRGETREPCL